MHETACCSSSCSTAHTGRSTAWNMTRHAGPLVLELMSNGLRMVLFLFQRGTYRRRIQELLLRPRPAGGVGEGRLRVARTAVLASFVLLSLIGCCSPGIYHAGGKQPGTSFSKEIDELVWSTMTIFRMPEWKEELTDDIETMVSDDPCALAETFELWGW